MKPIVNNSCHPAQFHYLAPRTFYKPILLVWLVIAIIALASTQLYPINYYGYNYYGIAYAMWVKKSFWYPVWITGINVQKPPLFYWLTHLCWWIFGVHAIFMPLIILLCYLLIAIYTAKTCFLISRNTTAAINAGLLVLTNLTFLKYIHFIRFDLQLTLSFILALYALLQVLYHNRLSYWWLYLFANLLGLLFKGPVIFLFTLPAVLSGLLILAPFANKTRYIQQALLFSLLAIVLCLLWLVPANIHSHGFYFRAIFAQTLQRFDHFHPDPNLPAATGTHFHWWKGTYYVLKYLTDVLLVPFLLALPLFGLRIYAGIKANSHHIRLLAYFMIVLLIPTLIFGYGVGLVRSRYLLPLIPLPCLFIGYLTTASITPKQAILERRLYQGYLWILGGLGILLLVMSRLPTYKNNALMFSIFALFSFITVITGWRAKNLQQRWYCLVASLLCALYIISGSIFFLLKPYPTIHTTERMLQRLSTHPQALIEINYDATREGWTQFLARNLAVTEITPEQFKQLPESRKMKRWIICEVPLASVSPFHKQIYPLAYQFHFERKVPVLMPYVIYKKSYLLTEYHKH